MIRLVIPTLLAAMAACATAVVLFDRLRFAWAAMATCALVLILGLAVLAFAMVWPERERRATVGAAGF